LIRKKIKMWNEMNGHTNRGGVEALALGQGAGLNGDGSGAGGGLGSDNGSAAHCVVILLKGRGEGKEVMEVVSASKSGGRTFCPEPNVPTQRLFTANFAIIQP
jgi:hypothetical protein